MAFGTEPSPARGSRALARALRRLPIFPLPNTVLFPSALMPLHIFEPRYRKMTRDLLDSHKLLGVALLLEEERTSRLQPRVAPVVGVGDVILAQELPDGRFNIVLRGRARVRIDEELPSDLPYRLVSATELPDDPPPSQHEITDAEASLRALVAGLADALPQGGDLLKQVAAAQHTPAELVDVLSAALVVDPTVRQELLETTDVARRIERVSSEIVAMTARVLPVEDAN